MIMPAAARQTTGRLIKRLPKLDAVRNKLLEKFAPHTQERHQKNRSPTASPTIKRGERISSTLRDIFSQIIGNRKRSHEGFYGSYPKLPEVIDKVKNRISQRREQMQRRSERSELETIKVPATVLSIME